MSAAVPVHMSLLGALVSTNEGKGVAYLVLRPRGLGRACAGFDDESKGFALGAAPLAQSTQEGWVPVTLYHT